MSPHQNVLISKRKGVSGGIIPEQGCEVWSISLFGPHLVLNHERSTIQREATRWTSLLRWKPLGFLGSAPGPSDSITSADLPSRCPGRKYVIGAGRMRMILGHCAMKARWMNSLSTPGFTSPEAAFLKPDEMIIKIKREGPDQKAEEIERLNSFN